MTAQQAWTINVMQWILTILMAVDVFGTYNVPVWNARNDGVFIVLFSLHMLNSAYRTRLKQGRWPMFEVALAALAFATAVFIQWH